jgi:hypothetical protein
LDLLIVLKESKVETAWHPVVAGLLQEELDHLMFVARVFLLVYVAA